MDSCNILIGSIWQQYKNKLEGLGMKGRERDNDFFKLASQENDEPWQIDR